MPSPADEEFLKILEEKYAKRGLAAFFPDERPYLVELLPILRKQLSDSGYALRSPIGVGSTAVVAVVHHGDLDQNRALKLPRPRLARLRELLPVLRGERERLASVSHQNVIRVYGSGEVSFQFTGEPFVFPYFIMEYLDPVDDFDKAILNNRRTLTAAQLIAYFRDAVTGISVLHESGIVHCDIKPGNLLIAPGRQALVTDLGYAKYIGRYSDDPTLTETRFTRAYGHPGLVAFLVDERDPDANVSKPPRKGIASRFDLFAYGRTMQDVLYRLREREKNDPPREDGFRSILTEYQWSYLSIISKRLLDGQVERTGTDIRSDLISGFGEREMKTLRYDSAAEAIEDFEKLLHLYDLEGRIPELNPFQSRYIQIPHCRVPLTDRVREIVEHPAFARLGQVSQLGFVSNVYPGAVHTRLEHVYGSYANCCDYIRALWYDEHNCLFQSIMSQKDLETGLLAALLHDIAQYPMAHDLTEVASEFDHQDFTKRVLHRHYLGTEESLAAVVSSEWEIDVDRVLSVLAPNDQSTVKDLILHSIIDGPIDCDKLDYIKRDSSHLGLNFGLAIDHERLLRNLTVVYKSEVQKDKDGRIKEILQFAEIGVREKALVIANSLLQARADMFAQVYWQHTARAMKAMLAHAVRGLLAEMDEKAQETFRREFYEHVFDPLFPQQEFAPKIKQRRVSSASTGDVSCEYLDALEREVSDRPVTCSLLHPADDALIRFLARFAGNREVNLLNAIRTRRLYRRVFVLSGPRSAEARDSEEEQKHKAIYDRFRNYRLDGDFAKIDALRERWQAGIVRVLLSKLSGAPQLLPQGWSHGEANERLRRADPLILVDVPVKSTRRGAERANRLRYLSEDSLEPHRQDQPPTLKFETSTVYLDDEDFDLQVGKIRVLVHPDYRQLLVQCLERKDYLGVVPT